MECNLIMIESTATGWRVADGSAASETYATKAKAIMAAYARATQWQQATGKAVAIRMPDDWGDTVVVGTPAWTTSE